MEQNIQKLAELPFDHPIISAIVVAAIALMIGDRLARGKADLGGIDVPLTSGEKNFLRYGLPAIAAIGTYAICAAF